ncbi:amino acid ABC transporter permease [Maridesulfovibrio hydrothermalis]|uniref:Putative glutamine transport system permease protein GlnP n=1 Tax=Maridesulfovibrio hydrothermalis AM13 = DSM 14728 TaxID=1121451 RepID=L0RC57_9BACT|nr:amino acid ABC transporter permease [Maridesulfovibrio hydrothermalis]CCO24334.1 Polar amino acid ABC transporter, inner membrane subunit [Maridesulfovibrio hydrothermalis AM13 = DSM 14728]
MSGTSLRAPGKGRGYELFWKTVFFVGLFTLIAGLFYATKQVDYVWRWERIPSYFYYEHEENITTGIEGHISSIKENGANALVLISGEDNESEQYEVPVDSLQVYEDDTVFVGDTIGYKKEWRTGLILEGLIVTLKVSAIAIVFAIILGLFTGLARISENPALKLSAITYIELIRGSPLLVQIFIWYFVLGTLINSMLAKYDIPQVPPLWFGIASLAIFAGAYVAEIVRAGIQSVHKGQMEAARSLGMSKYNAMKQIILPQAFRRILPPLAGQFISMIKDSSLLGVIAIRELTKGTREAVSTSLQPFELWFLCAILYLILTFTFSMFVQYLERRMVQR